MIAESCEWGQVKIMNAHQLAHLLSISPGLQDMPELAQHPSSVR
jgi:hypothetical protein